MILGAVRELTEAHAAIRAPLPLSRRIGVVAVDGGSGCSAVAATLANVLARRRSGPVLGVDAAGGRSGLLHRCVGADPEDPATRTTGAARRATATSLVTATSDLPTTSTGGYVLDASGPGRRAVSPAEWAQQVTPIARFFDVVVTDWGVRDAADLSAALTTSHVLVLVARTDRASATAAAAALSDVPDRSGTDVSLVLVDIGRTADRIADPLRRSTGLDVQVLPWDASWSGPTGAPTRRFRSRTRRAHIRLAVGVMDAAVRSRQAERLRSVGKVRP